mmetsp:Transcript_10534/g.19108  ORF Transcript_10534/g.19108 Transcript_10534/m.19108 type:complete len:462 (+) Transcript_10534:54-1439(+)
MTGTVEDGTLRQEQRDVALLPQEVRSEASYRRAVVCIGFSFFGVFGGFQAAQGLQTSVNAELGFINLAVLYLTFSLVCLIAPPALATLEDVVGLRLVMLVCSLAYVAMVVSNIHTEQWALPISMNALVGVAAPLLWTSQNDYVGRCAYHGAKAKLSAQGGAADETSFVEEQSRLTAALNGSFFSIYQFTGMFGTLLASTLMLSLGSRAWMKDALFLILGGVSLCGAASFLCMPRVPRAPRTSEASPSLRATVALVADYRMALMVPLIFTNGMTLAFILGDFPTDVVCPVLGSDFTGFVIAAFFGVNSIATAVWGRLTSTRWISRRSAYCLAGMCEMAFLACKIFWKHPDNFTHEDGKWEKIASVGMQDALAVFMLSGLFAVGDAFWEPGPPATLQNFYLGTDNIVPAMANLKLWQSLGFAVQFAIGAKFGSYPVARDGVLLCMIAVSILCILILNCKASLQ